MYKYYLILNTKNNDRKMDNLIFLLGCVVSIGLPLILWIFPPDGSISLKWALPVLAFVLILLAFSGRMAYQYYQRTQNILPKLIRVETIKTEVIWIFEPSELYSNNAIVSLFFDDEGYERLIGLGYVFNVQEDKHIQILITQWISGQEEIKDKLEANNAQVLKKVIAKPYVNRSYVEILEEPEAIMETKEILKEKIAEGLFPATVIQVLDETYPDKIVINLGSEHQIKKNQRFQIYSLSDEEIIDPENGESLGRLEIVKGTGKVVEIQLKAATLESDGNAATFDNPKVGDKVRPI